VERVFVGDLKKVDSEKVSFVVGSVQKKNASTSTTSSDHRNFELRENHFLRKNFTKLHLEV